MATFKFQGKVEPICNEFTLVGSLGAHWEDDIEAPVKLIMDASISFTKGIIEIVCESNLFGTDNYDGAVDWRANYLARSVLNCYAFATGTYLYPALETVVKPDGIKYIIQTRRSNLASLTTILQSHSDGGVDIHPILRLVMTNPTIFAALKDLIEAIPAYNTEVNCARAVEAIRQAMAPTDKRIKAWQVMQDNLNVTERFLQFITEHSKGPRHGDVMKSQFAMVNETIRRSWIVMNRFLEFKKNGDQKLPLSTFPLLDE